jgi:uncharacterized protein (TIGR03790 family)
VSSRADEALSLLRCFLRAVGALVVVLAGPAPSLAVEFAAASTTPILELPRTGLTADDIAVVINDADPYSVEVGAHYAAARRITSERVIHLRFPAGRGVLTAEEFGALKAQLDAKTPPQVQAYALAWAQPYGVACMSVTAAVAFGFDRAHCADGCRLIKVSAYFDSDSTQPSRDLGMRPAMLLAARDVRDAHDLVERGVRADGRWPDGRAYLMRTSDPQRDVRAAAYVQARRRIGAGYPIDIVKADALAGRRDVMFYFTGLAHVAGIGTNAFLDGALADHVTSSGGVLIDSPQMSVLDWIHAGVTGSYGTAFEPCNFRQKFPDVGVLMARYLAGETLIEAYWKSVQMPGQGVFVGDPLARPFGGVRQVRVGNAYEVSTRALRPGRYQLQAAPSGVGPYRSVGRIEVVDPGIQRVRLPVTPPRAYRLVREPLVGGAGALSGLSRSSIAWSLSRMPPHILNKASTSDDSTSLGSRWVVRRSTG